MEPPRSVGGRIQRKPLADCTNIVSRSSQQSSSSSATVKFANPSLTSSLKRLVDQTTVKDKSKDVTTSEAGPGSSSRSPATSLRPVTRRMSSDLGFPATAPPRPQNSRSDWGVGDKDIAEPYSVYTRKASGKKRNKDASSSGGVARLRLDLVSGSGKKTNRANENKPKPPLKVARKKPKRQRTVKKEEEKLADGAFKDYIEQQKAYFAEVDAFELLEEEVTSSSDLD